ncbi:MAG: hypothetical protein AMXMBFR53_22500 [Gemmatimonadota bacterium]
MVGLGGAAENRVKVIGTLVALGVGLGLGWAYRSVIVGVGAFVAAVLIAAIYAQHAAQAARERRPGEGPGRP